MSLEKRRIAVATTLRLAAVSSADFFSRLLAACNKSDKPAFRHFASPDDAGNGLLEAAKSGDQNAVLAIFGPGSKELVSSGDAVQDKATADAFVAAYGVMHRWRKMPDGSPNSSGRS